MDSTSCRIMVRCCGMCVDLGISAGQVVPHSHFHVVPRYREAGIASMFGMLFCGWTDFREGTEGGVGG
jgi:diadenosine tetraphosphate (Ap4A) HIT family hydrolase